jgi:hypothetical protein
MQGMGVSHRVACYCSYYAMALPLASGRVPDPGSDSATIYYYDTVLRTLTPVLGTEAALETAG